jgi:hypothetical protein
MATRETESLAADAASYLGKSENTVDSRSGSPTEIRRQSIELVHWARERKVILPDNHAAQLDKFPEPSTEHEVFFRPSDNRFVKCTRPGCFGKIKDTLNGRPRDATPLSYLRRIELMNIVFEDDLVFEGVSFAVPRFESKEGKLPYLVISQGLVDMADRESPYPSREEVSEFMETLGFSMLANFTYQWYRERDQIVVADAKPPNFIKSPQGIVPIDLLISRITV